MTIEALLKAIWDCDKARGYNFKQNLDMFGGLETALYGEWPGAARIGGSQNCDVFFLSFDNCNERVVALAKFLRQQSIVEFLVLVCGRGVNFIPLLRPSIRPGGVLFHPVTTRSLRETLTEVVSEIERLNTTEEMFNFNANGTIYRISCANLLFFEAINKKIQIHTTGQQIDYYDSIDHLEKSLPSFFVRCHRSFIVNVKKVREFHKAEMELRLNGDCRVPVSRSFKDAVVAALTEK
jgi:DNA-binding LytR/AlgR family response regulator